MLAVTVGPVKLHKKKAILFLLPLLCLVLFISQPESVAEENDDTGAYQVTGPLTMEVVLQREYLDGEISEETVEEVIWSMEDFWSFYSDWQLVGQSAEQVVFKQEVNDISPLLKLNGYFGLSEGGTLSIFNGRPEDNEVIQSFFQIHTDRLKSQAQSELQKGIPVSTKDQYLDVIQMYEKYAKTDL
ncbi:intercompartmental signaling factor BofC [Alteribacter keqinensis]|uniref:Sporulation-like protein BofC n=1 Tax=Alteribacter keqinensis TaxID=2483800 RepID=A0A3M7TT90_9BACI|nr:intercompartmental signaling factor BofC [Alteribacter keqinensis]RNA68737.1 sporulation-like protein BofC [Alteribacter keqinensis]